MTDRNKEKNYNNHEVKSNLNELFENLPEIMRVSELASLLGVSVKTIYDWKYRSKMRKIPQHMFMKINRMLFIRTKELKKWLSIQN